jgi:hypothetical protein
VWLLDAISLVVQRLRARQCNTTPRLRSVRFQPQKIFRRFSDSTWIQKNFRHYFFEHFEPGGLLAMEQRGRNFSTLEKMCLERARLAEKEMKYWMAEAEEWARLKNASPPFADVSATQLDCFLETTNQ